MRSGEASGPEDPGTTLWVPWWVLSKAREMGMNAVADPALANSLAGESRKEFSFIFQNLSNQSDIPLGRVSGLTSYTVHTARAYRHGFKTTYGYAATLFACSAQERTRGQRHRSVPEACMQRLHHRPVEPLSRGHIELLVVERMDSG